MLFKQSVINWLVTILFLGFTLFLGIQTWDIQNSYNPMFGCPDTKVYPKKQAPPNKKYCYDKKGEWELKLPDLKLPKLKLPDLKLPKLKLPDWKLPELKLPDWKLPDFKSFSLFKEES